MTVPAQTVTASSVLKRITPISISQLNIKFFYYVREYLLDVVIWWVHTWKHVYTHVYVTFHPSIHPIFVCNALYCCTIVLSLVVFSLIRHLLWMNVCYTFHQNCMVRNPKMKRKKMSCFVCAMCYAQRTDTFTFSSLCDVRIDAKSKLILLSHSPSIHIKLFYPICTKITQKK